MPKNNVLPCENSAEIDCQLEEGINKMVMEMDEKEHQHRQDWTLALASLPNKSGNSGRLVKTFPILVRQVNQDINCG